MSAFSSFDSFSIAVCLLLSMSIIFCVLLLLSLFDFFLVGCTLSFYLSPQGLSCVDDRLCFYSVSPQFPFVFVFFLSRILFFSTSSLLFCLFLRKKDFFNKKTDNWCCFLYTFFVFPLPSCPPLPLYDVSSLSLCWFVYWLFDIYLFFRVCQWYLFTIPSCFSCSFLKEEEKLFYVE